MFRKTQIVLFVAAAFAVLVLVLRFGNVSHSLWVGSAPSCTTWLLPLVIVAALVDSFNPCAFSVLLLSIAFLFSIGRLRRHVFALGITYILGLYIVYLLLGLGLLRAMSLFGAPHLLSRLGAALLIGLGVLDLINYWFPRFPVKLKIPSASHHVMGKLVDRVSFPAFFLLGAVVGLFEFPCTGGPYSAILMLLNECQTFATAYWRGMGYLLLYNLLFVSPLVVILLVASDRGLLEKFSAWQKRHQQQMRLLTGLALLAIGLLIFVA
ncbi:MAG: cytochrome c biogenesis protein CcdA [Patescibacteria group bacterium]|nr:cytochrome c biogenesis protein CcdA [Patescibacteria group bacterium]